MFDALSFCLGEDIPVHTSLLATVLPSQCLRHYSTAESYSQALVARDQLFEHRPTVVIAFILKFKVFCCLLGKIPTFTLILVLYLVFRFDRFRFRLEIFIVSQT